MALLQNYFGIDFGTTNCATVCYSVVNNIKTEQKYGDEEGRTIPSVVAIDNTTGEIYTGREAWNKKMELADTCVYIKSIKSELDKDETRYIAGKPWTPIEIAAEVFKSMKRNVAKTVNQNGKNIDLNKATVAIPIGFSAEKRNNLRKAAKIAGIDITSFVSEPTAAFYANYEELKPYSNVAIFDWGGGTLDVSIIQNSNGRISELATVGMNTAGDDIDEKIALRLHAKICRKKGKSIEFKNMPPSAQDMLLVRSERAKRQLSDSDEATISILKYGELGTCKEILDYDWFTDIISPEVDAAIDCLYRAIDESELGIGNIEKIVMVGGSSNLGPLIDKMEELFGEENLLFPESTMWNVGQGAALLEMTPGDYCSNQSIGLKLSDGSYFELLAPNTPIKNWKKSVSFGLVDTDNEIRLVFSGCKDIDTSELKYKAITIPAYKFLEEQIIVKALVDENKIFSVLAKSNMRPLNFSRIWNYEKLKCYYMLPRSMK